MITLYDLKLYLIHNLNLTCDFKINILSIIINFITKTICIFSLLKFTFSYVTLSHIKDIKKILTNKKLLFN